MVFPPATGRLINDLATDMNAFVESILSDDPSQASSGFSPAMDIEESDDGYEFALDLPGVKVDDIHVDVDEDRVTIHGVRHDARDKSTAGKRRVERNFGEFRRVVQLPKAVDRENIVAEYEDGVLWVKLPKAVKAGARRVVVSRGSTQECGESRECGESNEG
jgi:HSP20 family protein